MRDHDGRNKALFEQLARDAHHCDDFEQLVDRAKTLNEQFAQPLGDEEVMKIAASVWKMTIQGRNRFGQHGAWLPTADVDALISDPYQLALVGYLKAHNAPHSTFWVADGLGEKLGWPRRKFKTARQRIVQTGVIVPLSKPRPGRPVAYRWGRPGSPHSITSKPSYPLS